MTAAWVVHAEWLPLRGESSADTTGEKMQNRSAAEQQALRTACCSGARYVSVQGPDDVVTFEWDRYTNRARRYRPPDRSSTE